MPKVSSPVIRATIITSRKKKGAMCPIILRVQYHGRSEKYLPISVPEDMWDFRNGRVKSSHPSSITYNRLIISELQKAETRMLDYQRLSLPFTAKDLLTDNSPNMRNTSLLYKDIGESLLKVGHYAPHTVRLYRYSYNLIVEYVGDENFLITCLTSYMLDGFCRWLSLKKKLADSSINAICARIAKVYRYGIDCGLIDETRFPYPFKNFKYWQTYKIGMNRFGLSKDVMDILESDYVKQCAYSDGIQGIWWYKENVERLLLHKRSSELFVQCLLLMCYHMQGLALTDLLRVRAENITIQKIEGDEYYIFTDLHRKKTGESIDVISVKRTDTNAVIFDMFINTMSQRDGWFLPILYGKDESKYDMQVQMMTMAVNAKIKKIFNRIDTENNGIVRDMGIDVSKITYYTFRHTFATAFIERGGNPFVLADLMGRSPNNICVYVNGLSNVNELIKAKRIMED